MISRKKIRERIAAARAGQPLRILDIFAGCGGFSLGFQRAGFSVVGGLELEPVRARTFFRNLLRGLQPPPDPSTDISVSPKEALKKFGASPRNIDGIIGGPPCQAYARIGRAKLREVAAAPEAHVQDPRARLYKRYLDYVAEVSPLFIVMENVPDILSIGGRNIAEDVARTLDQEFEYEVRYTLLNAAGYGVPQFRERLFMIGIHKEVGIVPRFPKPTCRLELPIGFRGTCAHAHRALALEDKRLHISPLPDYSRAWLPPVSVKEALSDLPRVRERLRQQGRGPRDLGLELDYHSDADSEYQRRMRSWPRFRTGGVVTANETRYLERDFELFENMAEGAQYPEVVELAETLVQKRVRQMRQAGQRVSAEQEETLRRQMVPPYDPNKFPNKWRKMERDAPARTLMAHLSHDSYTHIHYDSEEARTITVREAARLQSFPDGFQFCGAMNAAFAQIGNAVPPLLALAVARQLKKDLGRAFDALDAGQHGRSVEDPQMSLAFSG